jgi:hypothetical protein
MKVSSLLENRSDEEKKRITSIWIAATQNDAKKLRQTDDVLVLTVGKDGLLPKTYMNHHYPSAPIGMFDCYTIKSLVGLPRSCYSFSGDTSKSLLNKQSLGSFGPLSSLDGAPDFIEQSFSLISQRITSLSGIGRRYIKSCRSFFLPCTRTLPEAVLGLMLVKNLTKIGVSFISSDPKIDHLVKILNKHLVDRDILSLQEELIDNDFDECAKL